MLHVLYFCIACMVSLNAYSNNAFMQSELNYGHVKVNQYHKQQLTVYPDNRDSFVLSSGLDLIQQPSRGELVIDCRRKGKITIDANTLSLNDALSVKETMLYYNGKTFKSFPIKINNRRGEALIVYVGGTINIHKNITEGQKLLRFNASVKCPKHKKRKDNDNDDDDDNNRDD